jgi:hypothetical integral membrane protein (TIGR02206 family)
MFLSMVGGDAMHDFFYPLPQDHPGDFVLFGAAHIVALMLSLGILVLAWIHLPRAKETRSVQILRYGLIAYLAFSVLYKQWTLFLWEVPWYGHLPNATCGIAVGTAILALITRNRTAYVLTLFWGWGAFLALVAPNLNEGPDKYLFYQFFLRHGALILAAIVAMRVDGHTLKRSDYRTYVTVTLSLALLGFGFSRWIDDPIHLNLFYMMRPAVEHPILMAIYETGHVWYVLFWIGVAFLFGYLWGLPFWTLLAPSEASTKRSMLP